MVHAACSDKAVFISYSDAELKQMILSGDWYPCFIVKNSSSEPPCCCTFFMRHPSCAIWPWNLFQAQIDMTWEHKTYMCCVYHTNSFHIFLHCIS